MEQQKTRLSAIVPTIAKSVRGGRLVAFDPYVPWDKALRRMHLSIISDLNLSIMQHRPLKEYRHILGCKLLTGPTMTNR